MDLANAVAGVAPHQLALVAAVALFASVIGGVAGYGTGALMPLVLVPLVGAEPVVPIIAISALLTNAGRAAAFRSFIDRRRVLIVLAAAVPTCILGAYGYTRLTNTGAMLVIGAMLILTVPLRRLLRRKNLRLSESGLAAGAAGYGLVVGGTAGSGVILLSLLMAAGLEGAGVVATDAAVSIVIALVRMLVFGLAGVVGAQVIALALLIGGTSLPGTYLAKALVARLPVHVHAVMLDAVVLIGGAVMVARALYP
jgi:uncharacterized membrane protein YfcA